eukprot:gene23649-32021_t
MLKKSKEEDFLEWEKISEGPWTKRRKHQVVVWENKILLMGGFDGESAFDLNDVWSWEENVGLVATDIALLSYETKFSFSGVLTIPFFASATYGAHLMVVFHGAAY